MLIAKLNAWAVLIVSILQIIYLVATKMSVPLAIAIVYLFRGLSRIAISTAMNRLMGVITSSKKSIIWKGQGVDLVAILFSSTGLSQPKFIFPAPSVNRNIKSEQMRSCHILGSMAKASCLLLSSPRSLLPLLLFTVERLPFLCSRNNKDYPGLGMGLPGQSILLPVPRDTYW